MRILGQDNQNNVVSYSQLDEKNGFIPKDLAKLTEAQLKAYENKPEFGIWNGNGWDINEVAKLEQQIAEAKAYLTDTGWIWEKYNRNMLVLKDMTNEEFRLKYSEIISKQEEARQLINTLEAELGAM